MAIVDVFFGKSEDRREAERELRQSEDKLMAMDPAEETSLPVHAKADSERLGVVLSRLRVVQATSKQHSDRNLVATIASGMILIAMVKGGSIAEFLLHLLASL